MPSKITLALGTALAGIALFCFMESGFAQDAVVASIAESDTDYADESDGRDDKSHRPRSRPSGNLVSANSRFVISSSESLSLGVTNVSETAEVEGIVVTGTWFDTYPVPYPALPPVEGTRINAGKKTSFVKPEEFPTFAGNDYREVMATTPGIIVSEEPQSPIINICITGVSLPRRSADSNRGKTLTPKQSACRSRAGARIETARSQLSD